MNQIGTLIEDALLVYQLVVFAWALASWLPQLSPNLASENSVIQIRRFLDSVVIPFVRLFKFVPQPMGFPLDMQVLAAFATLFVAYRFVVPAIFFQ
jgi:hypothetical protein